MLYLLLNCTLFNPRRHLLLRGQKINYKPQLQARALHGCYLARFGLVSRFGLVLINSDYEYETQIVV